MLILVAASATRTARVVSRTPSSTSLHPDALSRLFQCSRALSLVSKDSRIISAPFQLQSIALVGAKPILRFLCILETTKESLRNVQSLFIGCPNLRLVSSTPHAHTVEINTDAIQQAVVRILGRTAGTLRVLHTHLTFLERPGPLYPIPLRHLRVLVLHGPFQSPPRISSASASTLPNLRRLRFASPPTSPHRGAVLLRTVAAAAPRLSHLCISHTACTRKELECALEDTDLRNLTRLVMEMSTSPQPQSQPTWQCRSFRVGARKIDAAGAE
ncbi:hypothetical protein B0H14DRAFT_2421570 [Mycena olivaceomarginata]|nr:hypothetical protein B0H14DRAFT_2421570 [Mycena olivaceomarginata]